MVGHVKPLLEWKTPRQSWHIPLLAALCVAVPVMAGVWSDHPKESMLGVSGAMVILYLPQAPRSLSGRMLRLIVCSLGFAISHALGSLGSAHPLAAAPALGAITVLAITMCRIHRLPPPGSFFFVLTASIACNAPFDPGTILQRTGMVAAGSMVSCVVALVYCVWSSRRAAPIPDVNTEDRQLSAILVEAGIIGCSVAFSLVVARILKLENPYWVPISCAAILQGGTFRAVWHRKVHRIVGTILGMGICWLVFPRVPDPKMLAFVVVGLVFVVEYLVPRHYGLAVIFITPLTVIFAEFASGGAPMDGLFFTRVIDIILGSLIGAIGGWLLHHPRWCRKLEDLVKQMPGLASLHECIPSSRGIF